MLNRNHVLYASFKSINTSSQHFKDDSSCKSRYAVLLGRVPKLVTSTAISNSSFLRFIEKNSTHESRHYLLLFSSSTSISRASFFAQGREPHINLADIWKGHIQNGRDLHMHINMADFFLVHDCKPFFLTPIG